VLMRLKVVGRGDPSAAQGTLIRWGNLLRRRFDTVNLKLTMRGTASQTEQTVFALTKLQSEVEATRAENARLVNRVKTLESSIALLMQSTAAVGAGFNELSILVTGLATRSRPEAPVADILGAAGEDGSCAGVNAAAPGAEVVAAPKVGVINPRGAGAAAAEQPNAIDVLMAQADAQVDAPKGTAGVQAREFVHNAWVGGDGSGTRVEATLDKRDKRNGKLALTVYNAVMTPNERKLLKRNPDEGQAQSRRQQILHQGKAIVNEVEERVVEMLKEWCVAVGAPVPASLMPPKLKHTKAKRRRTNGGNGSAAAGRQPLMVHTMDRLKRVLGDRLASGPAEAWWKEKQERTRSRDVDIDGGERAAALPAPEDREVERPAGSPSRGWMSIFGKRE